MKWIRLVFAVLVCVIVSLMVFLVLKEKTPEIKREPINAKICNDMATPDLKITCLAIFSSNPSMCKETGNFDTYCYEGVFESMKNVSEELCKSFLEYFPRTACYHQLAKLEQNPSLCEKTGGRYQQCSRDLAKITKNYTLCQNIEADFEKYECLAEVTGDTSFCKEINSDSERSNCFIVLGKNADINKCGETVPIENPSFAYSQQCIANVALLTKDISLCDMIESKETKWHCLAILSKNTDICEKGENQFWEDFCRVEYIKSIFTREI